MTLRYLLRHYTEYQYKEPVEFAHNQIRMLLRDAPHQEVLARSVRIRPRPSWGKLQSDYFANRVLWTELDQAHRLSRIFIKHELELQPPALVPAEHTPGLAELQAQLASARFAQDPALMLYTLPSRLVPSQHPALRAFAAPFFHTGRPVLEAAESLMQHIYEHFKFDPEATSITTPVLDVLEQRHGVCQDFAQLMIGACRAMGLPARYVSGYIETLPPPGKPRLVGADASHAWLSLWCGAEHGWQDLDPTNNQRPQGQHIIAAWGRDYDDVIPLNGVISGGGDSSKLRVRVDLKRLPGST